MIVDRINLDIEYICSLLSSHGSAIHHALDTLNEFAGETAGLVNTY